MEKFTEYLESKDDLRFLSVDWRNFKRVQQLVEKGLLLMRQYKEWLNTNEMPQFPGNHQDAFAKGHRSWHDMMMNDNPTYRTSQEWQSKIDGIKQKIQMAFD